MNTGMCGKCRFAVWIYFLWENKIKLKPREWVAFGMFRVEKEKIIKTKIIIITIIMKINSYNLIQMLVSENIHLHKP